MLGTTELTPINHSHTVGRATNWMRYYGGAPTVQRRLPYGETPTAFSPYIALNRHDGPGETHIQPAIFRVAQQ